MNKKEQKSKTKTSSPISAGENTNATPEVEPRLMPAHLEAWASMTTGIEDYARWQQDFAEHTGEGDPPFRRGRIWA